MSETVYTCWSFCSTGSAVYHLEVRPSLLVALRGLCYSPFDRLFLQFRLRASTLQGLKVVTENYGFKACGALTSPWNWALIHP